MSGEPIFAEVIRDAIPGWMRLLPFRHWGDLAMGIALVVDAIIEGLYEGRLASFPNQVRAPGIVGLGGFDSVDALPLIGRDRRIVQGFTEPPEDYARRLRQWRASWRKAGTAFGLLMQLRGVLGPNPPRVRMVSHHGVWHTIEPDGTLVFNTPAGDGFRVAPSGKVTAESTPAHPWDWDSADFPPGGLVPQDPFRVWIILYAPTNKPLHGTEGVWGVGTTFYGEPSQTIGTTSTSAHVELVRGIIAEWKAAGVRVPYIIIAFDPKSFDPLAPSPYPAPGMPDGHWGNYGKIVKMGPNLQRVSARLGSARYWRGTA